MTVLFSRFNDGYNGSHHSKPSDTPKLGKEAQKIAIAANEFLEMVRTSSLSDDVNNLIKAKQLAKVLCPNVVMEEKMSALRAAEQTEKDDSSSKDPSTGSKKPR